MMRVIKLSPDDIDMKTKEKVDWFFRTRLHEREPVGRFLLPKGRIAKNGIRPGERLVFTYLGDIVYTACSASKRLDTIGKDAEQYPYFFCVDVDSIQVAEGRLSNLEDTLCDKGLLDRNLMISQGWPMVKETDTSKETICAVIKQFSIES